MPVIRKDATTACQEPPWLFFQCDKNATSAKQIACGVQELCILFVAFAMRDLFFHPVSASSRRFIRDGSVAKTYWLAHFAA
jgi:hypothetical protein